MRRWGQFYSQTPKAIKQQYQWWEWFTLFPNINQLIFLLLFIQQNFLESLYI